MTSVSHRLAGGGGGVGGGSGTRCMSKRQKNANLKTSFTSKKNCWRTNCSPICSSVGMRARNGARPTADLDAAESIGCDQPEGMRITSWSRSYRPIDTEAQVGGVAESGLFSRWWSGGVAAQPPGLQGAPLRGRLTSPSCCICHKDKNQKKKKNPTGC